MEGFDYRTGAVLNLSRKEWKAMISQVVAEGGSAKIASPKAHKGLTEVETWVKGADKLFVLEIQGKVK